MIATRLEPPVPPLSDGVVTVRPFEDGDVEQIFVACQDEDIQRFIPIPRPYRRSDAADYVARTRRQWAEGWKAAFAIVPADDPTTLLGAVNLAISEAVGNSGYWVAPGARGQGVATRALHLVTEWALGSLGLGVLLLEIRPENEPSMAVARAAGFHEAGRLDVNVETGKKGGLIFSRLASDPPS